MYTDLLQNIGLNKNQSQIYEVLLDRGPLSASKIQRRVGIDRSLVYVVLNELIDLQLTIRDDSKKVAEFSAANPQALLNLVQEKESRSELAKSAYQTAFHQLQQAFQISSGQPGVRFYTGIDGLKEIYQDLNQDNTKELWLVRAHTLATPEMRELIKKQRLIQIKNGVKVRVINSDKDPEFTKYIPEDSATLTERRVISGAIFKNPAQILIYGSKIAITTYREPLLTTLIEHADIAETLRSMYLVIWNKTAAETKVNYPAAS
jgi:sugar-specific transcriptional regulator TrmB